MTGARDATRRPRRREFKHLVVVAAGTIGAMALVAAIVGLIPAIEAAGGQGTAGTFTPGNKPCLIRKGGCAWSGTFRSPNGATMQHVYYDGTLSAGPGGSTSVPAIYPGGGAHIVYPPHDSHAWVSDLFLMAFVGGLAGFLLWLIPLGLSGRESAGAVV